MPPRTGQEDIARWYTAGLVCCYPHNPIQLGIRCLLLDIPLARRVIILTYPCYDYGNLQPFMILKKRVHNMRWFTVVPCKYGLMAYSFTFQIHPIWPPLGATYDTPLFYPHPIPCIVIVRMSLRLESVPFSGISHTTDQTAIHRAVDTLVADVSVCHAYAIVIVHSQYKTP